MPEIQMVSFDLVGTLLYPEPAAADVYHAAGRRYGTNFSHAEVQQRFSEAIRAYEEADLRGDLRTGELKERHRWRDIVASVLSDVNDFERCFNELFEHFAQPTSWRMFPDAEMVIGQLTRRRVSWVIGSNFDSRLRRITQWFEPLKACRQIFISSEVGHRKPASLFFQTILLETGCPAQHCLFVGDNPINDQKAAAAVGMQTLLIDRAQPMHEPESENREALTNPLHGAATDLHGVLERIDRNENSLANQ